MEEWKNETNNGVPAAYGYPVVLAEGQQATLFSLHENDSTAPRHTAALSSIRDQKILISRAVIMGEWGTVHELAEGERYRCANAHLYNAVRCSKPVCLGPRRRLSKLVATGPQLQTVQFVIYTDLGGGIAREDRVLGYADPVIATRELSDWLQPVARFLASKKTLV